MALDFSKAKERLNATVEFATEKAKEGSAIAAEKAQDAAKAIQEKHLEFLKEKYKPLFPEEYLDPDFDTPKMVVIKDEDGRKGIEVCEGAMGWLGKEGDLEILFLYESSVPLSGLTFHPKPICDAAYYLDDVYKGGRFVNLGCFFEEIQKDKMTELRNIAYQLGAKSCTVETIEYSKQAVKKKSALEQKIKIRIPGKQAPAETIRSDSESEEIREERRHIEFSQSFTGHDNPEHPDLYWYAQDREILSLIEMRCSGGESSIKNYTVTIDSSSSEAMSSSMAKKIDVALGKFGLGASSSLEASATRESCKKLTYSLEF